MPDANLKLQLKELAGPVSIAFLPVIIFFWISASLIRGDDMCEISFGLASKLKFLSQKVGVSRDLNPGPPAPKAGIIPLDHAPLLTSLLTDILEEASTHASLIKP